MLTKERLETPASVADFEIIRAKVRFIWDEDARMNYDRTKPLP